MIIHLVDSVNPASIKKVELLLGSNGMVYSEEKINGQEIEVYLNLAGALLFIENLQNMLTVFDNSEDDTMTKTVKFKIIQLVQNENQGEKVNLKTYFDNDKNKSVTFEALSHNFSRKTNSTIEQFYIFQMVKRVKFFLRTTNLSLSEIAYIMNYSSVGYLSNQFFKSEKIRPSVYRKNCNEGKKEMIED